MIEITKNFQKGSGCYVCESCGKKGKERMTDEKDRKTCEGCIFVRQEGDIEICTLGEKCEYQTE